MKSSYSVKQPNAFASVGAGIGQGLAQQLPKEMAQQRLSQGLQNFSKQSQNMSPTDQLAYLASIPGALEHPQFIQSFSELARHQSKAKALENFQKQQQNELDKSNIPKEFPKPINNNIESGKNIPSHTTEEDLEQIQKGYIPKNQDQILQGASERYNNNRDLYNNNPQLAIEEEKESDIRNQQIANAYQTKHANLTGLQDNVVNRLNKHVEKLGAHVPANTYSLVEDKAIQSTKSKEKGGEGLTEQQAMKKYGKELDEISRDYQSISSIADWPITTRKPQETIGNFKSLQKKFKERDDLENFSDMLVANNGVSHQMASSIAYPVSDYPKINNQLKNTPEIKRTLNFKKGYADISAPQEYVEDETLKVAQKLAPILGDASPLAIAYELEKKGYDRRIWLDYLDKNRKNLKEWQARELNEPYNPMGRLNDWWLNAWSGIE